MSSYLFVSEDGSVFKKGEPTVNVEKLLEKKDLVFRDLKYRSYHFRFYPEHDIIVDMNNRIFFDYDCSKLVNFKRYNLFQGKFIPA